MAKNAVRIILTVLVAYLSVASSTAEAAKGVKKVGGPTHHIAFGIVQSITPDKTGYGTFLVRSPHHSKKLYNVNTSTPNNKKGYLALTVTSATRFEHHTGNSVTVVNPQALHKGQHVRVRYSGNQAELIHIVTYQRAHVNFTRHRTTSYNPYLHHASLHHSHPNHPNHHRHR